MRAFESLYEADRQARTVAGEAVAALPEGELARRGRLDGACVAPVERRIALAAPATLGPVSWVLTILGIVALIVLHELGHFTAAKAVGMRVERFSLFFPPTLLRVRRGETEYAIGAIPAGGYVKITGMNPEEIGELDPEVARRAYYNQAPWKRIVVILAGPGVNILIAFAAVLGGPVRRATSTARSRSATSTRRSQTLATTTSVAGDRARHSPPTGCCGRAIGSSRSTAARATVAIGDARAIAAHRCAGRADRRLPRGDARAADGPPRRAGRSTLSSTRATTRRPSGC